MDKRTSLSKATAWYTIGNLFIRSVSFLLLPLYSNLISTTEFGSYALIMSLYAIISVLYYAGLQSSLSKYYLEEENEGKRKEIFSTILNSIIIIGSILTIIIFITAGWISKTSVGSQSYAPLIRITFAALFFESIGFITLHLLRTKELAKKVVVYSSLSAIINFSLNVYFVYFLRQGIYGIILAQLITAVFLFVIMIPFLKQNYLGIINPVLLKMVFIFTFPLIIAGLLSSSVDVIDRFIIDHFLGKDEVGIYSFSYRIALVMNIFVLSLRSAWTPHSIRLFNEGNYKNEFGKTLTKIVAVSLLIFLLVSMFVDDLFKFHLNNFYLFDQKYRGGIIIIPVILVSYIFSAVVTYFSVYPYVSGRSIHFLISDLIALLLNIVLNFWLIPFFGIMGAAIATLFSYFGAAVYLFMISENQIKIKYEHSKLLLILLTTGIFYLVSKLFNIFYLDIVLFALAFGILYRSTGVKLKMIVRN